MPLDGTLRWGPGSMTQDPGAFQGSFTLPPYNPGPAYEEHMPATIFGRPVPCPQGQQTTPNNVHIPQVPNGQGFAMYNHVSDASAQSSFPGGNEPLTEATPTPVSSESTIGAATTSFRDSMTATSWSNWSPHVNPNFQIRPQTVEPNALNYPQNVVPWLAQHVSPLDGPARQCPVASGAYHQFDGRRMQSFMPQSQTQAIEPTQSPQTGMSGFSFTPFHSGSASAITQTELRANSLSGAAPATSIPGFSGGNPHRQGQPAMGSSYHPSTVPDRSASTVFLPSRGDVQFSSPVPPHPSRTPTLRYRHSRRMQGTAQHLAAASASSSGHSSTSHVSRHALPKGLDDPLDTRPEAKETAEMIMNMECKVCMSQPVDTVVFPCGHAMFCRWCAEKCMPSLRTEKNRVKESSRCPVCRCAVRQKLRIFLP